MEGDDVHGPQPSLWTCDVPPWSGPLTSWDCGRSQLSTASLSDHGKKWASWTCVTPRDSSLSCGLLWMLSTLGQEKLGRAQWRSPRGKYWLSCQHIKGNSRLQFDLKTFIIAMLSELLKMEQVILVILFNKNNLGNCYKVNVCAPQKFMLKFQVRVWLYLEMHSLQR